VPARQTNKEPSAVPVVRETAVKSERLIHPALETPAIQLRTFLEVADQGYAICLCNAPRVREEILDSIGPDLTGKRIGVYRLELDAAVASVPGKVRQTLDGHEFKSLSSEFTKAAISVANVEATIKEAERDLKDRPAAIQGLNQQREYLRKLGHPVVFWISEWLMAKLPYLAPDFWGGRSIVLEFPTPEEFEARSYRELSTGEWTFDSLDEARRKVRIYEDLIRATSGRSAKAGFVVNLGIIHHQLGEFDRAQRLFEQVLELLGPSSPGRGAGDSDTRAAALGNIGLIYQAKGDLDQALKYHEDALKIEREIGYRQAEASTLGNIGAVYQDKGDLDQALSCHEQVLKIHRQIGYRQGAASDLGNIGLIYQDKGDLDQALKYHQDALKIDREIGFQQGAANALGNIGVIYKNRGDLDQALKCVQDALKIHRQIGYQQGAAGALGNIGVIYKNKGDLDQALNYHEQALKIQQQIGYQQGAATALANIGLIYQDKGDLDQALKYHQDALKIDREIGYRQGEAQDLGNIGVIYQVKGDLDQALKCYSQSLRIYDQIGVAFGPDIVQGNLALLSRQMGLEPFLSACEKHGLSRSEAEKLAARLPPPKPKDSS
jgi:tetratricopeptide (TPR) repeat protein